MTVHIAARVMAMTTMETAADLGVSPGLPRQLLLAGQLRGEKLGRDWMIRRADVLRFKALPPGRTRRPRALNPLRRRPRKPSG